MGGSRWSQIAFLILLLFTLLFTVSASAATRQEVSLPSASSVAAGAGSAARSGSALRIDGPLQGEYIQRTGTGTAGTPIKVLPRIDYSIPRTIRQGTNLLRGGVQGLVLGAALDAMLDAVGAFIDENGQPVKPGSAPLDTQLDRYFSDRSGYVLGRFSTADLACKAAVDWRNTTKAPSTLPYTLTSQVMFPNGLGVTCTLDTPTSKNMTYTVLFDLKGTSCPSGSTYDPVKGACMVPSGAVPLTDSDYNIMEQFADAQDSNWLKELLRNSCAGSLAPDRCFDDLKDNVTITGPASVQGPVSTTSKVDTLPDGSKQTTTTTVSTTYNINYGNNYFDYRTTTTTTVTHPDGSTTTETTNDNPDVTEETKPDTATDTPFPDVKPFYEQRYKDGLRGVWDSHSASVSSSAFISFLNGFVPSWGGSCPSFSLNVDVGIANFGGHSFTSICYVLDFVAICMLVTATFMARRLIFGG